MSVHNDKYSRYHSQFWYDTDERPRGKDRRHIHKKARAKYKEELRREIEDYDCQQESTGED